MPDPIPDSLLIWLKLDPPYGRTALDKWIVHNDNGAELYDEMIAKYEAADEAELQPEFVGRRGAHLAELQQIRGRFRNAAEAGRTFRAGLNENASNS